MPKDKIFKIQEVNAEYETMNNSPKDQLLNKGKSSQEYLSPI